VKVSEVINETVNIGDEFGNEVGFESYERGSGSPLDGTVGVQAKIYFDNSTDFEKELQVDPDTGKKFLEFSVLDPDELQLLHEKLGRWLNATKD